MIKLTMAGDGLSFEREITPAQAGEVIKFLLTQQEVTREEREEKEVAVQVERSPERKLGKGCHECGSPARHRTTCSVGKKKDKKVEKSVDGNEEWQTLSSKRPPITQQIYERIKLAVSVDIPSIAIQRELGVSKEVVNQVVQSLSYDDYNKK